MLFQSCYDGFVARGLLTQLNANLTTQRQEDIDTGTKLNESHVVVNLVIHSLLQVGDHTTRNGSCHLTSKDFLPLGRLDDDGATFVLDARLGKPGSKVVTIVVAHQFHTSIDGYPIGMDIKRTHEDAYLQSAVMEIFRLFHLFYNDNLAIGRGDDHAFRAFLKLADGATEKVKHQQVYRDAYHRNDDKRRFVWKGV